MAIPAIPSSFNVQQGNGQVYASWSIIGGATSYDIQRSTDGISYSSVSTPSNPEYLDTSVTLGTQYWYKVASVNSSGTSSYTAPQSIVPAPSSEMSLGQIRLQAQQTADRVNSQFVSMTEWNAFINNAMFELYDLLVTTYEDYFMAAPAIFSTNGSAFQYSLPNGTLTFQDNNGSNFVPQAIYKLQGVDLAVSSANNAWVSVNKFNFIDRNNYIYPNSSSTIYGVFNMRYRMLGDKIEFTPTPSSGQRIRLWYIPRLQQLLKDTDLTSIGTSGWLRYVIVRAAKYALDKEESDSSKLDQELIFLKKRIEESAMNRDSGQPDKISDIRSQGWWGSNGGFSGPIGGY